MSFTVIGEFAMDVTPPWWRMAKHWTHWPLVNESIWSWDHPLRNRIRSVTVGFSVVEVTVAITDEPTSTGPVLLAARDELRRRISLVDTRLLEDELGRARDNIGGRYCKYELKQLESYWYWAQVEPA